jgi:MFS family permease
MDQKSAAEVRSRPIPATFRALHYRNYRLFFFGQMVSLIGTWMQNVAQQWLIYRLTGSAFMLSTINLVALPLVVLSVWSGSLSDRFPKRSIIVIAQVVMMLQAFILAGLTWTGTVQVWHVLVLAMLLGGAHAIETPARQSFVIEMVEDKQDLSNAIGLNSTIFNLARALGPAIAGVAVATTGEASAFLLNGISFLAVILSLLAMRLPPTPRLAHQPKLQAHLLEGLRYVKGRPVILVLISMIAMSAFLSMPYTILLPVFADEVLKSSAQPLLAWVCTGKQAMWNCQNPHALTYGLLMASSGIGAVMGALCVASLPAGAQRGRWLTLGNLAFPALLIGLAVSRSFVFSCLLLVGAGLSFVTQNALANTLLQLTTPDGLRGRVMSLYSLTFQGLMRLGGLQAGLLGDGLGAPLAVGLGAVVSLVYATFVAWRFPRVRNLV